MSEPLQLHASEEERAVVVRLGEIEFGIDVRRVREVLRVPPITRLPFPPPSILGIASVRGTLVPIMDLGQRLLDRPADPLGRMVVVRDPDREGSIGLLVDAVLDLIPLEQAAQEPPAEVESSMPAGWILGVIAVDSTRLVTLLELTNVLDLHNPAAEENR